MRRLSLNSDGLDRWLQVASLLSFATTVHADEDQKSKLSDEIREVTAVFLEVAPEPEASCRLVDSIELVAAVQEAVTQESLLTTRVNKIQTLLEVFASHGELAEKDRQQNRQDSNRTDAPATGKRDQRSPAGRADLEY